MKPKVLFVGEHPHGVTGNSNMMMELLNRVNGDKYDITVYAGTRGIINNPFKQKLKYPVIEGGLPDTDFARENLVALLDGTTELDLMVTVGTDLWMWRDIINFILKNKKRLNFKWASIFPYDTINVRQDWVDWLEPVDFPCVYSQYGYNILKDHVKNIRYFRPPLHGADQFIAYPKDVRRQKQKEVFQLLPDDAFVFGFFGVNQLRKDPQRMIKAFFKAKEELPNIYLYLHTNVDGSYNLDQYMNDCGKQYGDVYLKVQGKYYDIDAMVSTYNIVDCSITSSLQEGLNWTIVEAMLCGTPIIASDTTAHKELLAGGAGLSVKADVLTYLPLITKTGLSWVEANAIDIDDMVEKIKLMVTNEEVRNSCIEKGLKRGKQWIAQVSDINELLADATKKTTRIHLKKKEGVLFAQHSSAGDVFMTTRCFKDLKQRHPDMKLVYMTSPQYMDIIINNPYIDEVISWDENKFQDFSIVYNPHGDRILPGHWGRNSNSLLSDFYWKVLMIDEPDDFFIEKKVPSEKIGLAVENEFLYGREIVILHTTGGDPEFRTYKYMKDVADELWKMGYYTIQVGGKADYNAHAMLDLRGKLSFRETAWVVSKAKYAITVDSFISHLCGALGVSQICLFGSGNHFVVRPNQIDGELILKTPDYVKYCRGLGPCSASVRDCPVKCTGIHDPKGIIESFITLSEGA